MISLNIVNDYEITLSKLRGFGVLLSSNEVRDSMPQETATGLEYILLDIIDGFEATGRAMTQDQQRSR